MSKTVKNHLAMIAGARVLFSENGARRKKRYQLRLTGGF